MTEYDQRLLRYDQSSPEVRKTLLDRWFTDKSVKKLFKTVAENQVIRAFLEFRALGVVPFEDYQKLERKGLVESRNSFRTYVPVARGYEFPEVRLTSKGEKLRVQGVHDYGTEELTYKPFLAYRVRETGNGIVASREVLEQWLDDGDEDCLMLLVDPKTGERLEDTVSNNLDFFAEICDPVDRLRLVAERSKDQVSMSLTDSAMIYSQRENTFI